MSQAEIREKARELLKKGLPDESLFVVVDESFEKEEKKRRT